MKKELYNKLQELISTEKVVIIYSTEWCGECKMTKILIEKKEKEFNDIKFYEIDVDENKLWEIEDLNIKHVPTFHFYKNGELKQKESNYIFEEKMDLILKNL